LIYHDAKDLRDNVAAAVAGEPLSESVERQAVVTKLQDRITLLCSRRDEKVNTANAAAKSDPAVEATPSSVETFILL
jgi:hypothetical protein